MNQTYGLNLRIIILRLYSITEDMHLNLNLDAMLVLKKRET
jgi:hypothetical protein